MRSSIRLGKLFGIEIGLHYSWFLIALLITMSLGSQFRASHAEWGSNVIWALSMLTAMLFFVTLLAHEMSHALVARTRGLTTKAITLFALGGVAQIEKEPEDAKTEFLVGIVGPLSSAVIGLVFARESRGRLDGASALRPRRRCARCSFGWDTSTCRWPRST